MGRKTYGSGSLDKADISAKVNALLTLGEPFQVIATAAATSSASPQDTEVTVLWGVDAFTYDEERVQVYGDGQVVAEYGTTRPDMVTEAGAGQCEECGSYNPHVRKVDGCEGSFHPQPKGYTLPSYARGETKPR